jgi:hypothetical protein
LLREHSYVVVIIFVFVTDSRDATNRCSPWPPEGNDSSSEAWNYHLELYLTVMERLAFHLGMVLQRKHTTQPADEDEDEDDITSSPLLFPSSTTPQWNVDVLRGAYFDLHHRSDSSPPLQPFPIVEFTQDSETNTGHVLIRLQGHAMPNEEFPERSQQPVTLVFDACFRKEQI